MNFHLESSKVVNCFDQESNKQPEKILEQKQTPSQPLVLITSNIPMWTDLHILHKVEFGIINQRLALKKKTIMFFYRNGDLAQLVV